MTHEEYSFQHDRCGAGAIVAGLREALATPGTIVHFHVAQHPNEGTRVYRHMAVGFEKEGPYSRLSDGTVAPTSSWRIAGPDGTLDGDGSHALIPTWYADQSIEHACATLGVWLMSGMTARVWIFRLYPLLPGAKHTAAEDAQLDADASRLTAGGGEA